MTAIMSIRIFASAILFAAVSASLTQCGSSKPKVTTTSERSVGQQLVDLEEARQKGLISDREFKRLKKAIVKSNG